MFQFRHFLTAFLACIFAAPATAQSIDLTKIEIVDLTHPYNAETIFWPTSPIEFEHSELAYGQTPRGYFYSSYSFAMPEHGGTHLDAPIHFYRDRNTAEQIPLNQLITQVFVIDISEQANANRDYRLKLEDIKAFEAEHGPITKGSSVLLRTMWSKHWPNTKAYLGDDTPGDASNLSFPSFGATAIEYLVKTRHVALIGVDTASIDYGKSRDFRVHRIIGEANLPALENLTNLSILPPVGALLIALPIKIEGGSGGPARVVALIPKQKARR